MSRIKGGSGIPLMGQAMPAPYISRTAREEDGRGLASPVPSLVHIEISGKGDRLEICG